mgnify:CR=1 FL=1
MSAAAAPARTSRGPRIALAVLLVGHAALLGWGWSYWGLPHAERLDHPLRGVLGPAGGGGQLLGITGYLLMLATLAYSVRKWLGVRRRLPSTGQSLWVHVVAGGLAPVFILEHCGWRFDGLPGVAAAGLLFVSLGGVAGRFGYGRLSAVAGVEREKGALSKSLLLRASVGVDPEAPDAPDPAVVAALGAMGRLPLEASFLQRVRVALLGAGPTRARVRGALSEARVPARVRQVIEEELSATLTARVAWSRAEVLRRLGRWWRITHVAVAHATLALATMHVVLALMYSGTVGKIRALVGG